MTTLQRKTLLRLPVAERVKLAEDIWDSIAASADELPVTEAQRRELDRRLEARKKNPSAVAPWSEVRILLRKRR